VLFTVRSFTKRKLEGAEPLQKTPFPPPYSEVMAKGSLRGAKPLLHNQFPLPYEGRGIKGVG